MFIKRTKQQRCLSTSISGLYSFLTKFGEQENFKSQKIPGIAEPLQRLFRLLHSPQNGDIKEPRLHHIRPVNCISEQFCGDRYLSHTKSNQACQIEAAGFPASPKPQCVGSPSPSLHSTARLSSALSAVITTQSIIWEPRALLWRTTWSILISISAEKNGYKLI